MFLIIWQELEINKSRAWAIYFWLEHLQNKKIGKSIVLLWLRIVFKLSLFLFSYGCEPVVSHHFSRGMLVWISWSRISCHALPCIICLLQVQVALLLNLRHSLFSNICREHLSLDHFNWTPIFLTQTCSCRLNFNFLCKDHLQSPTAVLDWRCQN